MASRVERGTLRRQSRCGATEQTLFRAESPVNREGRRAIATMTWPGAPAFHIYVGYVGDMRAPPDLASSLPGDERSVSGFDSIRIIQICLRDRYALHKRRR